MSGDILSTSVAQNHIKARDRGHAVSEADRMWAPETAEDVDPVLLQPEDLAPVTPLDPAPAGADFQSGRHGTYVDVHRQTEQQDRGETPIEPGTYGQGNVTPATPGTTPDDTAKPKEIRT